MRARARVIAVRIGLADSKHEHQQREKRDAHGDAALDHEDGHSVLLDDTRTTLVELSFTSVFVRSEAAQNVVVQRVNASMQTETAAGSNRRR